MHQNKRARIGKLAVGALVGTLLSIGAATGQAAAKSQVETVSETSTESVVSQWDGWGGGVTSMRSGIRW